MGRYRVTAVRGRTFSCPKYGHRTTVAVNGAGTGKGQPPRTFSAKRKRSILLTEDRALSVVVSQHPHIYGSINNKTAATIATRPTHVSSPIDFPYGEHGDTALLQSVFGHLTGALSVSQPKSALHSARDAALVRHPSQLAPSFFTWGGMNWGGMNGGGINWCGINRGGTN